MKEKMNASAFLKQCNDLCEAEIKALQAERSNYTDKSPESRKITKMILEVRKCEQILQKCDHLAKTGQLDQVTGLLKNQIKNWDLLFKDDADSYFVVKLLKSVLRFFSILSPSFSHLFLVNMQKMSEAQLEPNSLKSKPSKNPFDESTNPFDDDEDTNTENANQTLAPQTDKDVTHQAEQKSTNPFDDEIITPKSTNPFDDESEVTTLVSNR